MAQYDASDEEIKRRFCKTIEVGKEVEPETQNTAWRNFSKRMRLVQGLFP